jgi:hypothetical protein
VDQNGRSVRARGNYISSPKKAKGSGYEGLGLGEGEEGTEFGSSIPHDTSLTLGKAEERAREGSEREQQQCHSHPVQSHAAVNAYLVT